MIQDPVRMKQALVAVIAAAQEMGLSPDDLCALAAKRLETNPQWRWVVQEHLPGVLQQLDHAMRIVVNARKDGPSVL